ncbi:hypothetical protein H2199_003564 [Coniosporium tulheliwenetii]|uniref:Uncharacterized protein n=1 Tax=Coniosporium tulheliwenetii TaxID=3383036 RepID=A0ACC2ZC21_9PEZI|nr:hypothetical protein H2199_003564 [Cladosporium sp. JES 115]
MSDSPGRALLPTSVARVKKIIHADDEVGPCSNNAAFVIACATEMFIQYLAEKAHDVVKSETKKPRRNVQYRDVATAVARFDNLEFLESVVPRTVKWGDVKRRQEAEKARKEQQGLAANGQTTLGLVREEKAVDAQTDGHGQVNGHDSVTAVDDEEDEEEEEEEEEEGSDEDEMDVDSGVTAGSRQDDDAEDHQLEMEMRGPRMNGAGNSGRTDTVGNGTAMG